MGSLPQRFTWSVIIVVALSLLYAVFEVGFTRPYLSATYDAGMVAARPPAGATQQLDAWRDGYRNRAELSPDPSGA
jgi:hypothetical protein